MKIFKDVLGKRVLVLTVSIFGLLIQVLLVVYELHKGNVEVLEELTSKNVVNYEVEECARMEKR